MKTCTHTHKHRQYNLKVFIIYLLHYFLKTLRYVLTSVLTSVLMSVLDKPFKTYIQILVVLIWQNEIIFVILSKYENDILYMIYMFLCFICAKRSGQAAWPATRRRRGLQHVHTVRVGRQRRLKRAGRPVAPGSDKGR